MIEMTTRAARSARAMRTVLLVDDHAMVAEGLALALESAGDITVVGVAMSVEQGLAMAAATAPDAIVLDAGMPEGDSADIVGRFLSALPTSALIVLGSTSDPESVMRTIEAGARGFLVKDQRASELADAVHAVTDGGRVLAAQLVDALVHRLSAPAPRRYNLTNREIDVLSHLAEGLSTVKVSEQLLLSVNTVRNHVQSAIRRLGAHSKLEAISIARREGLLNVPASDMST
jgi:DNA-binding NarL/FixJ family response regulator